MSKTFYLPVSQETCNYLQKLSIATDARLEVINRLFTSHKDDPDDSVLTSIPFQSYQKQYEELHAEFALAKEKMNSDLRPVVEEKVGQTGISFNWTIEDFNLQQVKIDIL